MPVSTIWWISCGPFVLDPEESFSVKNPQVTMVLFAVVSSEHVELFIVESSSVILYLWRAQHLIVVRDERRIVIFTRLLSTHILLTLILLRLLLWVC